MDFRLLQKKVSTENLEPSSTKDNRIRKHSQVNVITQSGECSSKNVENDHLSLRSFSDESPACVGYSVVNSITPQQSASVTSATSVCRICQLDKQESSEPLLVTNCACQGSVKSVHKTCLVKWICTQKSSTCELCGLELLPPEKLSDLVPRRYTRQNTNRQNRARFLTSNLIQLPRVPHFVHDRRIRFHLTPRKRTCIVAFTILLVTLTGISGFMTDKTFDSYNYIRSKNDTSAEAVQDGKFMLGLCLSILVFCATLLLANVVFWIVVECYTCHRRRANRRSLRLRLAAGFNRERGPFSPTDHFTRYRSTWYDYNPSMDDILHWI